MATKNDAAQQQQSGQQAQAAQLTELQIIQARTQAEFAMTEVGQQLKAFEVIQRKGQMFASSTIVPETYRGNVGNCVIALEMANRMGAVPLMVMQNLYIVHGQPGFSSKFLVASINASKKFSPLRYEFRGKEGEPNYGCRCYAYEAHDKEHKEPLYGDWVTWEMANKEGWTKKQGSKWLTMPSLMFRYRAAAFWQRVYCPEITMGLLTAEELNDVQDADYVEITSSEQIADEARKKSEEVKKRVAAAQIAAEGAPANVDPETGEIKSNNKK